MLFSPLARDYDSLDDGQLATLRSNHPTFSAVSIIFNELNKGMGCFVDIIQMELIKFFTRMNDYNILNYASGFRMSTRKLADFVTQPDAMRKEMVVLPMHVSSIMYWLRCRKNAVPARKHGFVSQLRMEGNMLKDIHEVQVHRDLCRRIRNHHDPQIRIWNDRQLDKSVNEVNKVGK